MNATMKPLLLATLMLIVSTVSSGCVVAEAAFITLHTRHTVGAPAYGESSEPDASDLSKQPQQQRRASVPDVPSEAEVATE